MTKRMPPERDGIICAWIHGTASRHVPWLDPQGEDRTAAIAELREVAGRDGKPRPDLLSREAGLFRGLAEGGDGNEWDQRRLRWMAELCRSAAGEDLDEAIVAEWTVIGRARANPPMAGPKI